MTIYHPARETQPPDGADGDIFDVLVIGAGVVGCAMARRFALEGARVAVIEKAPDILDGASKANSAILHTGFDAPAGSLELDCVRAGYREYREIRDRLGLSEEQGGAVVVAWSRDEAEKLETIRDKARKNGVDDVEILTRDALAAREPQLAPHAAGAVLVPGESIIDPWSAPYVYLRQAIANGASLFTGAEARGGAFDGHVWRVDTTVGALRARFVINCAGLYGDLVEQAFFANTPFTITPRKGQFVVFDKAARDLVSSVILPVPSERTKGIVLFRTVFGNLVVGPTAEDQQSRTDASTDRETLQSLVRAAHERIPALRNMPVTAVYAGLRPACEFKDYRIAPRAGANWITVGAIRSTGLSAALGIARHVYGLYGRAHEAPADPVVPRATVLAQDGPRDWRQKDHGEIVCHCEMVTRREIEAALSGPLRARTLGGLKRQTRATMGRCQGFYCTARLAELTRGRLDPPISADAGHE